MSGCQGRRWAAKMPLEDTPMPFLQVEAAERNAAPPTHPPGTYGSWGGVILEF